MSQKAGTSSVHHMNGPDGSDCDWSMCSSRQVCLFLKRGATQNDEDEDGQDPLSIAVQQANADIVTL